MIISLRTECKCLNPTTAALNFVVYLLFNFTALCCMLSHPDNGMLTLSGTSIGDSADYSCDEGFNLVGPPALTCQSDGTWDNPAPICQSPNG